MTLSIPFLAGLVFGLGLIVSGMGNPAKVLSFLDLAGSWDPSLAFVMIGAIVIALIPFAIAKKRKVAFSGEPMQLPTNTRIDAKLILGAVIFGIGWGLAGICPGPALLLLGSGFMKAVVFVVALLSGMFIFEYQTSAGKQ